MSAALISTCVGGRRAGGTLPTPVRSATSSPPPQLTAREAQVIATVVETGFCTLAAARLGMSVKTIEVHMARLREKFDVLSNYQLIAAYVRAQELGKNQEGGA